MHENDLVVSNEGEGQVARGNDTLQEEALGVGDNVEERDSGVHLEGVEVEEGDSDGESSVDFG